MVRDTRVPTNVFSLDICMLSCIREKPFASTSNRPAIHWSNKVNHRTSRGRLDEAYSDEEVSVAVRTCKSFAPKIAVVADNHSLLAIHTSDVLEGNISAYLLDNESSDDEGSVAIYYLLLQGVDTDNLSIRRCNEPIDRMTGCLVVLVTYVLHAGGVVIAVVQHNVRHVDIR